MRETDTVIYLKPNSKLLNLLQMIKKISCYLMMVTWIGLMAAGCTATPEPAALPTNTIRPSKIPPTATEGMGGWLEAEPGLEVRNIDLAGKQALLVRIELDRYRAELLYDPESPRTVGGWNEVSGALLTVNAGFFEPDYTSSGLLIISGETYGRSYAEREQSGYRSSGVLMISNEGASIDLLSDNPYTAIGEIEFALEGFPVLLLNGQPATFDLPLRSANRTTVALDNEGRLILIIVHTDMIALNELQDGLMGLSDELGIISALNLDGGPSTGIVIAADGYNLAYDSNGMISSVLAIFPK